MRIHYSFTHGRSTSVHLEVQLVAHTKGELQQSHVRIVSVVPVSDGKSGHDATKTVCDPEVIFVVC